MDFFVYILQSETSGRFYCGQTNNLERRIQEHNDPSYSQSKTTKRFAGPWRLVWSGLHESRAAAMEKERRIKARGIGRFLAEDTGGC
jgi:putative endonuclease